MANAFVGRRSGSTLQLAALQRTCQRWRPRISRRVAVEILLGCDAGRLQVTARAVHYFFGRTGSQSDFEMSWG